MVNNGNCTEFSIGQAGRRDVTETSPDVYFKQLLTFRFWRQELHFRVSQDLFSSHQVDVGTQFLLRVIKDLAPGQLSKILDLGCGYGPIGLVLKKLYDTACVHMVDRDALAVEYSRQNMELNSLSGVSVYESLGYDDVRSRDFDLIASNIPAKAGEAVISHLLQDAVHFLRPGGVVAIVGVEPIEQMVEEILRHSPDINLLLKRSRRGHVAFAYQFANYRREDPTPDNDALRVYNRGSTTVAAGVQQLRVDVSWGLPEFESLSFKNRLLIEFLSKEPRSDIDSAAIFNPGQGHVAVVLSKLFRPRSIYLIDRDLLALRQAKHNLIHNGFSEANITLKHQVGLGCAEDEPVQVLAGVVREDEGPQAANLLLSQATTRLSRSGMLVLSASSTGITRIIKMAEPWKEYEIRERKRWRGNSLVVFERR